jgi:hypothetical protein
MYYQDSQKIKRFIIIGVGAAVLLGGIIWAYFGFLSPAAQEAQAHEVAVEFLANILEGDTDSAYVLTSTGLQSEITSANFSKDLVVLKSETAFAAIEGASVENNSVTFLGKLEGLPDGDRHLNIRVTREGLGWKIDSIKTVKVDS